MSVFVIIQITANIPEASRKQKGAVYGIPLKAVFGKPFGLKALQRNFSKAFA